MVLCARHALQPTRAVEHSKSLKPRQVVIALLIHRFPFLMISSVRARTRLRVRQREHTTAAAQQRSRRANESGAELSCSNRTARRIGLRGASDRADDHGRPRVCGPLHAERMWAAAR